MKKPFLLSAAFVLISVATTFAQSLALTSAASAPRVENKSASIQWKKPTLNVGEIKQGVPKAVEFEFTNVSQVPVLLTQVQGSCGCTATAFSKEPVQPGKSSTITATYNAANLGNFNKTVTVTTNTDTAPFVLTLQGTVVAKAQ